MINSIDIKQIADKYTNSVLIPKYENALMEDSE